MHIKVDAASTLEEAAQARKLRGIGTAAARAVERAIERGELPRLLDED